MDTWEEKYNDLLWSYRKRGDRIDELEKESQIMYSNLSHAEFRIETELEPRIKREENSYDVWATNGGSDECFYNGMGGKCGVECSIFGDKGECFENITSKEIDNIVTYGHCVQHMKNLEVKYSCKKDTKLRKIIIKIKNWFQNKRCLRCWKKNLKFNGWI